MNCLPSLSVHKVPEEEKGLWKVKLWIAINSHLRMAKYPFKINSLIFFSFVLNDGVGCESVVGVLCPSVGIVMKTPPFQLVAEYL